MSRKRTSRKPKFEADEITTAKVRQMMSAWPEAMRGISDEWAQQFVFSIWVQAEAPGWVPTLKQFRVMKRVLREAKAGKPITAALAA